MIVLLRVSFRIATMVGAKPASLLADASLEATRSALDFEFFGAPLMPSWPSQPSNSRSLAPSTDVYEEQEAFAHEVEAPADLLLSPSAPILSESPSILRSPPPRRAGEPAVIQPPLMWLPTDREEQKPTLRLPSPASVATSLVEGRPHLDRYTDALVHNRVGAERLKLANASRLVDANIRDWNDLKVVSQHIKGIVAEAEAELEEEIENKRLEAEAEAAAAAVVAAALAAAEAEEAGEAGGGSAEALPLHGASGGTRAFWQEQGVGHREYIPYGEQRSKAVQREAEKTEKERRRARAIAGARAPRQRYTTTGPDTRGWPRRRAATRAATRSAGRRSRGQPCVPPPTSLGRPSRRCKRPGSWVSVGTCRLSSGRGPFGSRVWSCPRSTRRRLQVAQRLRRRLRIRPQRRRRRLCPHRVQWW